MLAFVRRMWELARPYQIRLTLGLLFGILFALTQGVLISVISLVVNLVFAGGGSVSLAKELERAPSFMRPVTDYLIHRLPEIQSPSSKTGLVLVILAVPLVMLLRAVFGYLNIYLVNWAATRAIADLRTRLFDHLQNLSLDFFSRARTGELISRITNDTQILYGIVGNAFASIVRDPLVVAVLLAVMFYKQPKLTAVAFIVLPVCLVPINIYNRKARKSARAAQGHIAELTSVMHEAFTGNRIIKAYNLEDTVLGQFLGLTRKYVSHQMRMIRANEIPSQLTEFLGAIGVALVLLYVVFWTDRAQATAGDFTAFIISIVLMYQPIKVLTRLYNQLHQAAAASQHLFQLLDVVSTVRDPASPVPLRAANADIQFENIQFDYGEKPVLQGINLTVKAGQKVALVGGSGSGKTTLTNLLLRFYDPRQGAVLIGGVDIRQVAVKDLRRQIALVAQETILFNDTVRNNIAVGRPGATNEEIYAAAKRAHAHEFILQKEGGYDSMIGERGSVLSVGQRQRITIARALLRNAPILVLDEATSALDSESERAVQADLDELMQGRTTLCIAHRLSTIRDADLIVVLDQGVIVQTGTHEELLAAGGVYRKLYELQAAPSSWQETMPRTSAT